MSTLSCVPSVNINTAFDPAELIETALQGLLRTTGLAAQIIRWEPNTIEHHQPDAVIEIDAHRRKHRFAVEAKTGVRGGRFFSCF